MAVRNRLSRFFNLRLRRGVHAVVIENPSLLVCFDPVFKGAEDLGFTAPVLRGGAVRDALEGGEINDYDVYVSRRQARNRSCRRFRCRARRVSMRNGSQPG